MTRHPINTGRRRKYFLTSMSEVSPAAVEGATYFHAAVSPDQSKSLRLTF